MTPWNGEIVEALACLEYDGDYPASRTALARYLSAKIPLGRALKCAISAGLVLETSDGLVLTADGWEAIDGPIEDSPIATADLGGKYGREKNGAR